MTTYTPTRADLLFQNMLHHRSSFWAWNSAAELSSIECPDKIPNLKVALNSPDELTRECCLEVLAAQGDPETVTELCSVFQEHDVPLTGKVKSVAQLRVSSNLPQGFYDDLDKRVLGNPHNGILNDPMYLIDEIPVIVFPNESRKFAAELIWKMYSDSKFFKNLSDSDIKMLHAMFYPDYDNPGRREYRKHKLWSFDGPEGSPSEPYGQLFTGPSSVPYLMVSLTEKLRSQPNAHPLNFIGDAYYHHNLIHPFDDRNGSVNFVLLNLFLLHSGLPYVKMKESDHPEYHKILNRRTPTEFVRFLGNLMVRRVTEN